MSDQDRADNESFPLGRIEELESTGAAPTFFCNRYFIVASPQVVRFAFAEGFVPNKPPLYRVAAALPHPDAVNLLHALVEVLGGVQAIPDGFTIEFRNGKVAAHVTERQAAQ